MAARADHRLMGFDNMPLLLAHPMPFALGVTFPRRADPRTSWRGAGLAHDPIGVVRMAWGGSRSEHRHRVGGPRRANVRNEDESRTKHQRTHRNLPSTGCYLSQSK